MIELSKELSLEIKFISGIIELSIEIEEFDVFLFISSLNLFCSSI